MNNIVPITANVPRTYNPAQLALIQRTVAKGTTSDEFDMFVEVCKNLRLDPYRKQIYCIIYSPDKPKFRKVAFITAIDGFRAIAERSGNYRPDDDEPHYTYEENDKKPQTNPLGIVSAKVKGFKQDSNGEWFPVVGIAYWNEFAPVKEIWEEDEKGKWGPSGKFELTGNWIKMPRVMIAKCAEAVMLRKGWPEDLSGLHSQDEMEKVASDLSATEEVEAYQRDERLKLVGGNNAIAFHWVAGEPLEMVPVGQVADKCLEFISGTTSPTELDQWKKTNQVSLRQFWAEAGTDALAVKQALEQKSTELSA